MATPEFELLEPTRMTLPRRSTCSYGLSSQRTQDLTGLASVNDLRELPLGSQVARESGLKSDLADYYAGKTQSILDRYGPGPRVHYHTGLASDPPPAHGSPPELKRLLVASQERLLHYAADVWHASSALRGDVLDVGCGLGGGSIFWAQEFGAKVIAVTCVYSHIEWISRFATQAGVRSKVQPLLCDALEVQGESRFDAAIAVDSSCHLPRRKWFELLFVLLRGSGRILISDCFLGHPKYQEPFDNYWHTNIGTLDEYINEAEAAGLHLESIKDISPHTTNFWATTIALMEAETRERRSTAIETVRRNASIEAHALIRRGLADEGLRYALISFRKDPEGRK
jgi:tocopherol O-methyltransferase